MDGHPSERPTRGLSEQPRRPPIRSCSGQSLPRFTPASALRPGRASSLWRWSSPHGGRALPAGLLYGARTFLERGLSADAPAAVRPPPGTDSLPDSNKCSPTRAICELASHLRMVVAQERAPRARRRITCMEVAYDGTRASGRIYRDRCSRLRRPVQAAPLTRSVFAPEGNGGSENVRAAVSLEAGRWPRSRGDPPPCSARAARAPRCRSRCARAAP